MFFFKVTYILLRGDTIKGEGSEQQRKENPHAGWPHLKASCNITKGTKQMLQIVSERSSNRTLNKVCSSTTTLDIIISKV